MNKLVFLLLLLSHLTVSGQANLPVTLLTGTDTSKPVIFYITGDGGQNKFSTSLEKDFNRGGYTIASLDAKSYFWEKKTPVQAATAISSYLGNLLLHRPAAKIIVAGYSFGADVLPFIVNNLPEDIRERIRSVVLIAPSTSTDFEIHWSDMFGWNKKRGNDVATAINRLNVPAVLAIFGDEDDDDLPANSIHLKNFSSKVLPGGHHFDGKSEEVVKTVVSSF